MPADYVQELARRFRAIQDVRYASARPEASLTTRLIEPDIRVETWLNSRLHIYLMGRAPKQRELKSLLKGNSGGGIGTLILLEAALLPADGACLRLRQWQDDLRVLNLGAIPAYNLGAGGISLRQVNLEETAERGIFACWHTLDFPFEAVSVRRREVTSAIRGNWLVGDIISSRFKRRLSEERARQRFHHRTRGARALGTPAEQISAAYLALEIEVGAGQEAVKEAFRKLAREYHPDVSRHDKAEAERRFKEVSSAYDKIKDHRRWR